MASTFQTLNAVYTEVRRLTNKDSTTLPDATILPVANKRYLEMVQEIIATDDSWYAEIDTQNFTADDGTYTIPADDTSATYGGGAVKIIRVECTYDGTNWVVAQPISRQELSVFGISIGSDTDTILDNFSESYPRYYHFGASIKIVPVPNTTRTNGLRIFNIARPNELTSSSSIPDFPKDFLGVLCDGLLYDFYRQFQRIPEARESKQDWFSGLANMRSLMSDRDTNSPPIMKKRRQNYH